jgi:hypothetical protein
MALYASFSNSDDVETTTRAPLLYMFSAGRTDDPRFPSGKWGWGKS